MSALGIDPEATILNRSSKVFQNTIARYLFALAMVAAALAVRMLILPVTGVGAPFVLFFAATLITSLFAGVGPGLLTIAVGMPLAAYMFVLRAGFSLSQTIFQGALYSIDGFIILYLTHMTNKARRALQRANRELGRANQEIARAAERTKEVIELAPDAFFLADLNARFTDVNRAACRMLGYEREELVGMMILDLIRAEEAPRLAAEKTFLLEGQTAKSEWMLQRKDGTFMPAEVSTNIISGGRWQAFVRDISERKQVEETMRRALAVRDQVLGIVAHDLRNPLGTIIMQSSVLARRESESGHQGSSPNEIILRAATRMNRLLQDLLDVALVEAAQLRIKQERVSTDRLVAEALDTQRPHALASNLDFALDLEREVADVWADHDRLLQVFENLIGNAIKFTSPGGRITVGARSQESEVHFWVADTGCGIAPRDLPYVFDRFWRAAERTGQAGSGLGLPITKGIVEAHGGRIWVESALGRGSTFLFSIPKAPSAEERPAAFVH